MTSKNVRTKMVPPDGGWGWVVLFSALLVNFLIPGTVKSFGVLFVEFLHVFKASSSAASWMPALCYFLYSSLGPLSSILSSRYSYKTVTLIGGTFAASGMMLSYFANSVSYLYVSYGLMVGIGAGLSFPPTVYIVTAYFERLRGFANGLCISGSAIGTIVLPPLLQYLLDCFGYRGAVLIMGAITLNTLVCGLLYHPVEQHMIRVPLEDGIDNEALTLDEPAVEEKRRPSATEKVGVDFHDETLKDPEEPTKRAQEPCEAIDSALSISSNEITSFKNQKSRKQKVQRRKTSSLTSVSNLNRANKDGEIFLERYRKTDDDIALTNDTSFAKDEEKEREGERTDVVRRDSKTTQPDLTCDSLKICQENCEKRMESVLKEERIDEKPKQEESSRNSRLSCSSSKDDKNEKLRFFDFSVLRDPIYLVILISNSTSAISNTNFMILLPSYAISEGFDKSSSALLLSVVSALDLVGRIGGASLSDIDFVPKYYYFVGGLGTSGIALALLPMASSYTMLSFFCALFGLSSGMYIGITTVILADMLGMEKLSSSYGISLFVNGVLQLAGPPVCGVVYETVGSYKPIFLAFGIILILGTALWAVVPLIKRNSKKVVEAV
ncbi:hypothetical protein KM043_014936 [Ampulex compressa]|nr:hypothetical protein KM043_014936 [Ampulex compressa]